MSHHDFRAPEPGLHYSNRIQWSPNVGAPSSAPRAPSMWSSRHCANPTPITLATLYLVGLEVLPSLVEAVAMLDPAAVLGG